MNFELRIQSITYTAAHHQGATELCQFHFKLSCPPCIYNELGAVRVRGENDLCPSAGNKSSCTFVSAPVVIIMFSQCVCSSVSWGHRKPSHHLEIKRWEATQKSATSPRSDKESLFWSMKVLLNPLSRGAACFCQTGTTAAITLTNSLP